MLTGMVTKASREQLVQLPRWQLFFQRNRRIA